MGGDLKMRERLYNRLIRRYEQGLQHGYRDCARLLLARGDITAHQYAAFLRATEHVSPETPPKRKVLTR